MSRIVYAMRLVEAFEILQCLAWNLIGKKKLEDILLLAESFRGIPISSAPSRPVLAVTVCSKKISVGQDILAT
jgi:hypothetical protein